MVSYNAFRGGSLGLNFAGFVLTSGRKRKREKYLHDSDAYNASQAAYGSFAHHDKLLRVGYAKDSDLSTHNTVVYHRNGTALVAYRGTTNDRNDYNADLAIGTGTHNMHDEFVTAHAIGDRVHKKYGNVHFTGHSLGGTKAIETAKKLKVKSTVFNPGSSYMNPLDAGDATVYRKNRDYISYNIRNGKQIVSNGGHSLADFEDEFS